MWSGSLRSHTDVLNLQARTMEILEKAEANIQVTELEEALAKRDAAIADLKRELDEQRSRSLATLSNATGLIMRGYRAPGHRYEPAYRADAYGSPYEPDYRYR